MGTCHWFRTIQAYRLSGRCRMVYLVWWSALNNFREIIGAITVWTRKSWKYCSSPSQNIWIDLNSFLYRYRQEYQLFRLVFLSMKPATHKNNSRFDAITSSMSKKTRYCHKGNIGLAEQVNTFYDQNGKFWREVMIEFPCNRRNCLNANCWCTTQVQSLAIEVLMGKFKDRFVFTCMVPPLKRGYSPCFRSYFSLLGMIISSQI